MVASIPFSVAMDSDAASALGWRGLGSGLENRSGGYLHPIASSFVPHEPEACPWLDGPEAPDFLANDLDRTARRRDNDDLGSFRTAPPAIRVKRIPVLRLRRDARKSRRS